MTTSTVTLVGDVSDLIGNDYDPSRTKVWVQHNTDKVVTDSGPIRLGAATKAVASDGTFSFANVVASTSLVTNLQATLWVDWPNTAGPERTRRQVSFGPYDLTGLSGTVDIRTLEATQALDPVASSALLSEMQDLRDQVQDISQIAVPDDVITAIDANPASDFRQQQDARQSASYAPLLTFPVPAPTGVASTDTTAILAADAAAVAAGGGLLQYGKGVYVVNAFIPLRSNITHAGVSRDLTTIKLANGANCNVFDYPSGSQTNVEVRDLTVDGNKANQTTGDGRGLQFVLTSSSRARRLRVINTRGQGINAYQGSDFSVTDCVVTGCGKAGTTDGIGIYATGVSRLTLTGNAVGGTLQSGILAPDCVDSLITNNLVTDIGFIGIGLGAGLLCKNVTISGNTIARCTDNAIDTGQATGITVTGNAMSDCLDGIDADLTGLAARTNAALVFSNNKIKNCGRYGIIVAGPPTLSVHNVTVTGNSIDSAQQHGICLSAVREATVSGNVIRNASKQSVGFAGIRMDGASVGNQGVSITGNRIYEDSTAQCYAIDRGAGGSSSTSNNYNVYLGNITRSCLAGFAGTAGPNDVQASNI